MTIEPWSRIAMRMTRLIVPSLAVLALVISACGSSDDSTTSQTTSAARTVQVNMQDNKYVPDTVSVASGETVKFVFTNDGTVNHDAFIGDAMAQTDHETSMRSMDGQGMGTMGAKDSIVVAPGKTGTLTRTFKAGDKLLIGCHEPGHYAGGMKLTITVT